MELGLRRHFLGTGLGAAFTLVLFGVLFCPGEALGQTRYWSTESLVAGVRAASPASPEEPSPSADQAETETALSTSPSEVLDRSHARASLRYDWDAVKKNKQDTEDTQLRSKAGDSGEPKGVTIEIFIDARTDASLRRMSADTGVPYHKLASKFLRLGHTVYTERLYCARSPYYYPPNR